MIVTGVVSGRHKPVKTWEAAKKTDNPANRVTSIQNATDRSHGQDREGIQIRLTYILHDFRLSMSDGLDKGAANFPMLTHNAAW